MNTTSEQDYVDTGATQFETEEIPDRLRNKVQDNLPNTRQILIQWKKGGAWKTIRPRIRAIADLDVDVICSQLIGLVRDHADGSDQDREYRAKIECFGEDQNAYHRYAQIRVRVDGDGDIEVQDSVENEERGHMTLITGILDSSRNREIALFDKMMEQSDKAFERNESMARANGETAEKVGELVGQFTAIGGALQEMLVGVTGMLTVGVELHSSHAEKNAEVQIAQMEMEGDQAKWAAGIGLLSKAFGPLGEQIASTVAKRGKNKQRAVAAKSEATESTERPSPAAVSGDAAEETAAVVQVGPTAVSSEWKAGKTQAVKTLMGKLDDRCREGIAGTLSSEVLSMLLEAQADGATDEATAANLVTIRQSIEQRVQDNDYAIGMCLAKLNGVLGDELTGELMNLLPDPESPA